MIKHIELMKRKKKQEKVLIIVSLVSLAVALGVFYYTQKGITSLIALGVTAGAILGYRTMKNLMDESQRIKKMEEVFPDFIDLMASNLRAGITIDKAILLSARKEFTPLDKEIMNLGKDIVTGKEISQALLDLNERVNSEKIRKTIDLIISGIRAGGNLSTLLEQTAANIREKQFVEKRAASNVLMYVIFIFFAVAVGAPVLFALSSVLVEILTKILSNLPATDTSNISVGFTLTQINISVNFIIFFAVAFIVVTDVLASLVLGLVSKGEEKAGTKYMIPLAITSVTIFFLVRILLIKYFSGLFT
ncbi:type II secretion system F family protein [Candidatus Pacearchaeota archaeon]|nr:type II secretion system F family protein [Candidatus Pacearchaeota archaeon]